MRTIRTFFLFILIVSITNFSKAQSSPYLWDNMNNGFNCDNLGMCSDQCWQIDTANHQNIWQVGPVSKLFLGSFSPFGESFITDTFNFYPSNNLSSFEFLVHDSPLPPDNIDCFGETEIIFDDMIDSDTLKDGGFIEISFDHKQTWFNIISIPSKVTVLANDLYTINDTLFNGQYGISGRRAYHNNWLLFKLNPDLNCSMDTFYLRFTFLSDSVNNNREGWRILNSRLIAHFGWPENIKQENKESFNFPTELLRCNNNEFNIEELVHDFKFSIIDITGKIIITGKITNNNLWIDCNISPGIYALKIYNKEYAKTTKVLIK